MSDDLSILLGGTLHKIGTQDVGVGGFERQIQLMKLLSAQEGSTQALDKLVAAVFGGAGVDVGVPILGVVNDHVKPPNGWVDGGYGVALLDAQGKVQTYPNGARKLMRDEFSGANGNPPDATKWAVARAVGAATATLNGASQLLLNTGGVTSGDGVEVVSVDTYQAPIRLIVELTVISQRIANQEFSIELIEESTAIDTAGTDSAKILFNGTVNTTAQVTSYSQGDNNPAINWTTIATSGVIKFEIDLMTDEVWFYDANVDNINNRQHYAHLDRKSPDPTKRYKVRLRLKNTGAAASGTTVQIDSVVVEDNSYLPVEVAHARGSTIGGEALPVSLAQTTAIATMMQGLIFLDSPASALAANAVQTGAARDLIVNAYPASGAAATALGINTSRETGRVRGFASADQPGTLSLDISLDGTTWDRYKDYPTAVVNARNIAMFDEPIISREARLLYTNGATLQGSAMRLYGIAVAG